MSLMPHPWETLNRRFAQCLNGVWEDFYNVEQVETALAAHTLVDASNTASILRTEVIALTLIRNLTDD